VKKLNVAVIGAGFWGKNHARIFSQLSNVNLRAVCDVDHLRASKLAEAYKIPYYTQLPRLLADDEVDAITICTPTITHYSIALEVIKSKKHLLVEKPMTSSVEEADSLIKEAEQRNLKLFVGFIERFNPAIQYVKQLIDNDALGNVILAIARRVSRWPERIGDVGVIKDSAIHDIDVLRYIFHDVITTVYASIGSYQHKFEDWSEIMLQFKDGEVGFIDANWLTPRKIRRLIITGSEATATLDYITQEVTIEDSKKAVKPNVQWIEPLKLELQSFTEAILNGDEIIYKGPLPTGRDGAEALKICEAALLSSKKRQAISIK
jgi:UDP-N-acetylglucosamine 3-dehydrogenase